MGSLPGLQCKIKQNQVKSSQIKQRKRNRGKIKAKIKAKPKQNVAKST
jgi:hypothetical protein